MMATTAEAVPVDGDKLMQFLFRALDELGATLNSALVAIGDKLGRPPWEWIGGSATASALDVSEIAGGGALDDSINHY